ncbi:hypothetical protein [Pseudomonas sp.]|uniref:hypothetical protein n=1 Tax=Pseudomonas sp. TaxID=306 RepID=UPI002624902B|nr:hypothetical protein [Pseudomonas sp.]
MDGYLVVRTGSAPHGGRNGVLEAEFREIERGHADAMPEIVVGMFLPDNSNRFVDLICARALS